MHTLVFVYAQFTYLILCDGFDMNPFTSKNNWYSPSTVGCCSVNLKLNPYFPVFSSGSNVVSKHVCVCICVSLFMLIYSLLQYETDCKVRYLDWFYPSFLFCCLHLVEKVGCVEKP